jgi:hypothetical protein
VPHALNPIQPGIRSLPRAHALVEIVLAHAGQVTIRALSQAADPLDRQACIGSVAWLYIVPAPVQPMALVPCRYREALQH